METIISAQGTKFDLSKKHKSNLIMELDANGRQSMVEFTLTGNQTIITEFGEKKSMIEIDYDLGVEEINEDFIWQSN